MMEAEINTGIKSLIIKKLEAERLSADMDGMQRPLVGKSLSYLTLISFT